jgi:endo-1,4-beta-xylanase
MLRDLRAAGVPVHGVGLQRHVSLRYHATEAEISETMRRFADAGLDVAITDVRADTADGRERQLDAQRGVFLEGARACREQPRCTSFTTWGVSDRYSWWERPEWMPLLFDEGFQAKPAYAAVHYWIQQP